MELLDPKTRETVKGRLRLLRASPRTAAGVTNLVALVGYRMKIGSLRARFIVRDEDHTVIVTAIVPRNERTY